MMKRMAVVSVVAMLATTIGAAADSQGTGKNVQDVTIRGCVMAGTSAETYLLMRVTEVKAGQARGQQVPVDSQGRDVLYSLDSVKGLKEMVGRRVEVRGQVDLNHLVEGESTVVSDPSKKLDATTEIKVPSEDQKVKVAEDVQPKTAPAGTSGVEKTTVTETKRAVYLMKVRSVRPVEGVACQ